MQDTGQRKKTFWERKRERIEKRFTNNRVKDAELREYLQDCYDDIEHTIRELARVQDDSLQVYYANNRALNRIRIEDRDRKRLQTKDT